MGDTVSHWLALLLHRKKVVDLSRFSGFLAQSKDMFVMLFVIPK